MSILQLSKAERERFALWLETNAIANIGLMEQADKLSTTTAAILKIELQRRTEAYTLVARELRSIEDSQIG